MNEVHPPGPETPVKQRQRRYWLWGGVIGAFVVPILLSAAITLVKARGITNEVSFMVPMVSVVAPFGFMLMNFFMWALSYYYRFPPSPGNLSYIGVNLTGWFATGALLGQLYGKLKPTSLPTPRKVSYLLLAVVGLSSLVWIGSYLSWRLPYANDPPPYARGYARSQLKPTDDPAVCERLSGNKRDTCYFQLAMLRNDENPCLKLPADGYMANRKTCCEKLAFRKHDEKICRNMADVQGVEDCIAVTALGKDDASLCEGLSQRGRADCYTNFSLFKQVDYCRHLADNPDARDKCYRRLKFYMPTRGTREPILESRLKNLLSNYRD